jgi:23S rRNA (cytosine1962-C5)-methyltransferase
MQLQTKHLISPDKAKRHAEMLSNRVRNKFRYLSKRFKGLNVECFRLYDWDIPEIRAVVDWYAGHIVIGEYERLQTGPDWLSIMAEAVAETLGVPLDKVHLKRRHTRTPGEDRYAKPDSKGERIEVKEKDLRFLVNLTDFLDTGLFSDHRNTRLIVRNLADGTDFLNLYSYTGAFTCAAAAGNARSTISVDRSHTYLKWAGDNMALNGFSGMQHKYVQSDVDDFLVQARQEGRLFNLAFVDPPSFSSGKSTDEFNINRDHPRLIKNVLSVMAPGATIFFSTNHQHFEPHMADLSVTDLIELTPATIPEDYRNRKIHRCWKITV